VKWFKKWRDRRTMKRLRDDFDDFRSHSQFCKEMSYDDAFRFYCQLEALGVPAVREMLMRGESLEMTID